MKNLALALLDDEYGINHTAYKILCDLLLEEGLDDIIMAISYVDGRYLISEAAAEALR